MAVGWNGKLLYSHAVLRVRAIWKWWPGAPSCSERLVAAGLGRVIVAIRDEHPQGAGGLDRLAGAGLAVEVGLKARAARALYRDFFEHAKSGHR